jgi:hypothetical protein
MAQNLMQRWREVREQLGGRQPEARKAILFNHGKDLIYKNLKQGMYVPHYRFMVSSGFKINRTMYKIVGKDLAQAIREDDWQSALEAINQYGTNVSIRADIPSILSKHFQSESFFCCEDCSDYCHSDEENGIYSGDSSVCDSCCEHNYTYSERQDRYISNEDWDNEQAEDEEEEEPEYEHIGGYHSSKRNLGHIPSSYDLRSPRVLLGLELEIEVDDNYDKDTRAKVLLDGMSDYKDEDNIRHTYCLMEEDGSLENGFEMVTAYTGLDVHKAQLQYFKNRTAGLTSHDTSTCGLHVHVCKSSMTTLHAAKMVLFINDPENIGLVKAIARRSNASYSKIKNKKDDKHWLKDSVHSSKDKDEQIRRMNSDRYEALNFKNDRTIEFRLFKGTLKYETMIACLEFSFACWHFTASASTSELTTSKFLEFICMPEHRKDTRFLRAYLKEKGYALADNLRQTAKPALAPAVEV